MRAKAREALFETVRNVNAVTVPVGIQKGGEDRPTIEQGAISSHSDPEMSEVESRLEELGYK